MTKSLFVTALLCAGAVFSFAVTGCKSDPHETHITTNVAMPR